MKDFRWKDGGMEGWKRPMKVPFTHTGRKDILRPVSTIAFLEQERTNFFCHTVLGQGVRTAGQKDRQPHKPWWFPPCHHSTHSALRLDCWSSDSLQAPSRSLRAS